MAQKEAFDYSEMTAPDGSVSGWSIKLKAGSKLHILLLAGAGVDFISLIKV